MTNSNVPSQVVLNATEVREIISKQTDKKYKIYVSLPYHYVDKPEFAWPVVYLLDAHLLFGMVSDMVRTMAFCSSTTDAIVVGITYSVDGTPREVWKQCVGLRAHDMTPEQSEKDAKENSAMAGREVQTGGAPFFLKFIQDELIPIIEQSYRTHPARKILVGHSYGGLFTLFALFQEPSLFQTYIASSPSLFYKDNIIFDYENRFAKRRKRLSGQVHLLVGELEEDAEGCMVSNLYRLATLLESHKLKGLSLVRRVFPGEDHCSVIAPAFHSGLKMALAKQM